MTRDEFVQATGHEPNSDELERVICPRAGTAGHWMCGLCPCGLPLFECLHHSLERIEGLTSPGVFGIWARAMDKLKRQG